MTALAVDAAGLVPFLGLTLLFVAVTASGTP
jgi:hypothetical protein